MLSKPEEGLSASVEIVSRAKLVHCDSSLLCGNPFMTLGRLGFGAACYRWLNVIGKKLPLTIAAIAARLRRP